MPLLERLRSQQWDTGGTSGQWEVLIVDNNSTDETATVVQQAQAKWLSDTPLRYCFEGTQGLAYARQRGVDEARGIWIGFLDDDNLPAHDWVAEAYQFAFAHPQAGAIGGQIHGDYAVPPPKQFKRIQSFLAVRERGETPHRYQPDTLNLPPGAALVVRRDLWLQHVPRQLQLVGRVGGSYLAGEDYEALLHIAQAGWEIWYCPTMHTYHQIPDSRLQRDYLLKVVRGAGLCVCPLRLMAVQRWQQPFTIAKMMGGSLNRLVRHVLKHGWLNAQPWSTDHPDESTSVVSECERAFIVSCLVSPLFWCQYRLSCWMSRQLRPRFHRQGQQHSPGDAPTLTPRDSPTKLPN